MPEARVGYAVGREANADHGETFNGAQLARAEHRQFKPGVDPYRKTDTNNRLGVSTDFIGRNFV